MLLNWPTFVVERRINQPPEAVQAALRRSDALAVDTCIELGPAGESASESPSEFCGELRVETPWRPALCWHSLSWRANGRLVNGHGHLVARVEIEVGEWSDDATRLQVRPRARRFEHWTGRRMKHYFPLAHDAADRTARELSLIAEVPETEAIPHFRHARAM
jgi:hypothetical protein